MEWVGIFAMPVCVCGIILFGLLRRVPVFSAFTSGAKEGFQSALEILPTLVGLVTAVSMLKASGALDLFASFLEPAVKWLGLPPKVVPLALLRPVSGSGSLALLSNLFEQFDPDSQIGRIASVMMGSTETTFYAVTVYYGAVSIKKTRHTIPAAVTADLVSVLASIFAVRLFFSG